LKVDEQPYMFKERTRHIRQATQTPLKPSFLQDLEQTYPDF